MMLAMILESIEVPALESRSKLSRAGSTDVNHSRSVEKPRTPTLGGQSLGEIDVVEEQRHAFVEKSDSIQS